MNRPDRRDTASRTDAQKRCRHAEGQCLLQRMTVPGADEKRPEQIEKVEMIMPAGTIIERIPAAGDLWARGEVKS